MPRLSKALEEILRQVTPNRFAVPTACGCARVAMYLMTLYQNPKKLKPKVVKSGEDFQRDLKAKRREVARMVSHARAPQSEFSGKSGYESNKSFSSGLTKRYRTSIGCFRVCCRSIHIETPFGKSRRVRKRPGKRPTAGGRRARRTPTTRSAGSSRRL
jgi:hypothetical protein